MLQILDVPFTVPSLRQYSKGRVTAARSSPAFNEHQFRVRVKNEATTTQQKTAWLSILYLTDLEVVPPWYLRHKNLTLYCTWRDVNNSALCGMAYRLKPQYLNRKNEFTPYLTRAGSEEALLQGSLKP